VLAAGIGFLAAGSSMSARSRRRTVLLLIRVCLSGLPIRADPGFGAGRVQETDSVSVEV
jgi:hypothetical protein